MKVNRACKVFAPALSKHGVIEWFNGSRTVGWYKDDKDFFKKREYLRILVNAPLMTSETANTYTLKKGNLYEG